MSFGSRALPISLAVSVFVCLGACGKRIDLEGIGFSANDGGGDSLDGDSRSDGGGGEGGTIGEVEPAPCDPLEFPPDSAVYVSERRGVPATTPGAGAAGLPVDSIAGAFELARASKAEFIAVDEGLYQSDSELVLEALPQPVRIDGAWKFEVDNWARDCDERRRGRTLLQSPTDVGVRLKGTGGGIVLANMTIETRAPSGPKAGVAGASRFGVVVESGDVRLLDVTVKSSPGESGGPAREGTPGDVLCPDTVQCTTNGADGVDGKEGPPAASGAFSTAGFTPGSAEDSPKGTAGSAGTPGSPGERRNDCELGCEATNCTSIVGPVAGGQGTCGCGGNGGGGGGGGLGGGASVGLFVIGGSLRVRYSEIIAERGGDGSEGGAGGLGGSGALGAAGVDALCYASGCCQIGSCPGASCQCYSGANWPADPTSCTVPRPMLYAARGGAAGGAGRPGGRGGRGGGGAGGPSFAYVVAGSGNVQIEGSRRTYGAGGTGRGGAPGGRTGEKP